MSSLTQSYIEVCVFRFDPTGPSYLIMQRSPGVNVYPGIWQFITGTIEGRETAAEAAVREVGEETRLKPTAMWIVPYVNSFYDHRRDAISLNPVFAVEVPAGSDPVISAEHERFEWLSFEDALRRLVWPGQHAALRIVHEFIIRGREAMHQSRIL